MTDKLDEIFRLQKRYDDFLKNERDVRKTNIAWVQYLAFAIIIEAGELLDSTPWKWWKNNEEPDWRNIKEEIADITHFLISLCHHLGISSEEFLEIYVSKNTENFNRQLGTSARKGYEVKEAP